MSVRSPVYICSQGGLPETQEMRDFCTEHTITADVEVITTTDINTAYERMLKSDVKHRFPIDMATLQVLAREPAGSSFDGRPCGPAQDEPSPRSSARAAHGEQAR